MPGYLSYQGAVKIWGKRSTRGQRYAWRLVSVQLWVMDSVSTQRLSEPTWDMPMDPEKDLARKIQVTWKSAEGGLALGFGEADLQI